jgi:hypothetical protein
MGMQGHELFEMKLANEHAEPLASVKQRYLEAWHWGVS